MVEVPSSPSSWWGKQAKWAGERRPKRRINRVPCDKQLKGENITQPHSRCWIIYVPPVVYGHYLCVFRALNLNR